MYYKLRRKDVSYIWLPVLVLCCNITKDCIKETQIFNKHVNFILIF